MSKNIARALAIQVEVCVVCKIYNCWSIGFCCKGKTKLVFFCPVITRNSFQSTRIAHFTILRIIKELYSTLMLAAFPNLVLKTIRTSVKMIRAIINRQVVLYAIKLKLS